VETPTRRIWTWEGRISEGWRKFHRKKLYNIYCSPNIVRIIKPVSVQCTKHGIIQISAKNFDQKESDILDDQGVDGRIILHLILQKDGGRYLFYLSGLRQR
jgi:hypothetical protein